jgi:hypothetical protein
MKKLLVVGLFKKLNAMLKKSVLFLFTVVVSSSTYAQTQEPILGIKLGQLASEQFFECPRDGGRDNWCFLFEDEKYRSRPREPKDSWSLYPSDSTLPTWVKRSRLLLRPNAEGVVDNFTVSTFGQSVQDRVVGSVTTRFGEPKKLLRQIAKTGAGVEVETVFAVWETSDTAVIHLCTRVDACSLKFFTKDGYKKYNEKIAQDLAKDKL